ncbi:MAG: HlyD family efflux transporter periplasmic adaptor subunit [Hyphomicrobiales bacterium]
MNEIVPKPAPAREDQAFARALQNALQGAIAQPSPKFEPEPPPAPPAAAPIRPQVERRSGGRMWGRPGVRRAVKTAIGLAIVVAAGWAPVQLMMQAASVEAVINARLVVLRAPIEGRIEGKALPAAGSAVAPGQTLFAIHNERAERGALDTLRDEIGKLEDERPALTARLAAARAETETLTAQLDAFRRGRIAWLETELAALGRDTGIAAARKEEAMAKLTRSIVLARTDTISRVALDDATRGARIAHETLAATRLRREQAAIELQAMADGSYLGDSYNDRPQSAQKLEAAKSLAGDLEAELRARDARKARLTEELAAVSRRFKLAAEAAITAPVAAHIWELLAVPGEQVVRGQDLVRLLDCSAAVVTAAVSEKVYNKLYNGMPARFVARGGDTELEGAIVNLTGIAGASSNYAIEPSALIKEPYRVTVAVPGLADELSCDIGRTGLVLFGAAVDQPPLVRLMRFLTGFAA